jgi:hypothetical protein
MTPMAAETNMTITKGFLSFMRTGGGKSLDRQVWESDKVYITAPALC